MPRFRGARLGTCYPVLGEIYDGFAGSADPRKSERLLRAVMQKSWYYNISRINYYIILYDVCCCISLCYAIFLSFLALYATNRH